MLMEAAEAYLGLGLRKGRITRTCASGCYLRDTQTVTSCYCASDWNLGEADGLGENTPGTAIEVKTQEQDSSSNVLGMLVKACPA
jgi:hypothetical protein